MKAIILAGGFGTRISEESGIRPKPMVEIGGKPILWHIMKIYSAHNINDFVICCGYKGDIIKEYFANYCMNNSDVSFDMRKGTMEIHRNDTEDWKVTLVNTGYHSMTGGRMLRVRDYIGGETFCMTYGDGVSDVDITASIQYHREQGTLATLTAVQQPGRFGLFNLAPDENKVKTFQEKPDANTEMPWINGGFFVLEPEVLNYIDDESVTWEREPLENLSRDGELSAFRHAGFWQPMDTLRDKNLLEDLWQKGIAPWQVWKKQKLATVSTH